MRIETGASKRSSVSFGEPNMPDLIIGVIGRVFYFDSLNNQVIDERRKLLTFNEKVDHLITDDRPFIK